MGKFEDYINEVIDSSAAGIYKAGWQIHILQEDYKRKYGRYPSKSEFLEYGNSLMEGNFCTSSKPDASTSSTSFSTNKNNTSQPSEEALKILKSLELNKEKSSNDSVPNVSFNKAYKIWKQMQ